MNCYNYSLIHVKGETNIIKQCISQKNETQSSGKTCRQKTIPATMIIELALPLQKVVMFVQTGKSSYHTL